jgi:hypothetical protein
MRIPLGLKHQGFRSHQLRLPGFVQGKNPKDGFCFDGDPQLHFSVERALGGSNG